MDLMPDVLGPPSVMLAVQAVDADGAPFGDPIPVEFRPASGGIAVSEPVTVQDWSDEVQVQIIATATAV